MTAAVLALLSTACGFAIKTLWDAYVQKRQSIELESWKIRVSELEKRLSQFYWPIYLRLQRDNVVWRKILDRENQTDEGRKQLACQIEGGVLLPNHEEILRIIENNAHLAGLDKEFEKLLLSYVRHVDVYRSIRAIGIKDRDPINFGEPYPKEFFPALEKRLIACQEEYDQALRTQGIA